MSKKAKELKFKIEKQEIEVNTGTDKYEIRTKGGNEVTATFPKGGEDKELSQELDFEYRKKTDGDKEKWTDFKKKLKYTGGLFFEDAELENKQITTSVEAKNSIKPPLSFFGTMRWPMYLTIGVIVLAIVGLIWWWIASSNKEDKEEESL